MTINTFPQLQAARAKFNTLLGTKNNDGSYTLFMTPEESAEFKSLELAIKSVTPKLEKKMRSLHISQKSASNKIETKAQGKIMNIKTPIRALATKALPLSDVTIAIDKSLIAGVILKVREFGGFMSKISIQPTVESDPIPAPVAATNSAIIRFEEADGSLSYSRPQTGTFTLVRPTHKRSRLMSKVLISKEAIADPMSDLEAIYQDNVGTTYSVQLGQELVSGDGIDNHLGILGHFDAAESVKSDVNRPQGFLRAVSTGTDGKLGSSDADARLKLLDIIDSVPTAIRNKEGFALFMHKTVLKAYRAMVDTQGNPLLKYKDGKLEDCQVVLDDHFPAFDDAGTTPEVLFAVGDADSTLEVLMLPSFALNNDFVADGARIVSQENWSQSSMKDNTALSLVYTGSL